MQLSTGRLRTCRVLEVKEHFLYASQLHTTHPLYFLQNSLPGAVASELQLARSPAKQSLLSKTGKRSAID